MVFNPLEPQACARYAGAAASLHPPPKGWPRAANAKPTKPTKPMINAGPLEATLASDYNVRAAAFVVLGLDDQGKPFALPSPNYDLYSDRIRLAAPWHQVYGTLTPVLAANPNPPSAPWPRADDEARPDDWVEEREATDSDESRPASVNVAVHAGARKSRPRARPSPKGELARARKRPRSSSRNGTASLLDDDDDDPEEWPASIDAALEPQTTERFRIDDRARVIHVLALRLDQMQQLACKVILKAWIKNIEPKKQSKFPYVGSSKAKGGEGKKQKRSRCAEGSDTPPWWPTRKEDWWSLLPKCGAIDEVRHKEPDHLKKEERLVLGVHLLLTQAERDPGPAGDCGIKGLIKSTKDCSLQFDQDTTNGTDRKSKRHRFLNEIYDLAEKWSDYRQGGLDPDSMVFVKIYPKQALATKRKRVAAPAKQRPGPDAGDKPAPAPRDQDSNGDDLILSTGKLELDEGAAWGYPPRDGLPESHPVDGYYMDHEHGMRMTQIRPFDPPSELQPPYDQAQQMMHSPVYPDLPMQPRYSYDTKIVHDEPQYIGSDYSLNREPGFVAQPPDYSNWRPTQPAQTYSPASTVSMSHASTHAYDGSPSTTFPGRVDYSFAPAPPMQPTQSYHSPISQDGSMAAPSHGLQQSGMPQPGMMQAGLSQSGHPPPQPPGTMPMSQAARTQSTYDTQYNNHMFRTGSLNHPNMSYGMDGRPFGC